MFLDDCYGGIKYDLQTGKLIFDSRLLDTSKLITEKSMELELLTLSLPPTDFTLKNLKLLLFMGADISRQAVLNACFWDDKSYLEVLNKGLSHCKENTYLKVIKC